MVLANIPSVTSIAAGLSLVENRSTPGGLTLVLPHFDGPRQLTLSPEEVDKLVLSALSMTKPEDLGGYAEGDYQAAMDAVRVWQATCADRENARRLDAERDAVLKEAGYRSLTYAEAGPAVRYLVDRLIEAMKAGQK